MELRPEPILPTRVESDAHGGDYMPAWRALLPVNVLECQAAGLHVGERETWAMVDISVPGAKLPMTCFELYRLF